MIDLSHVLRMRVEGMVTPQVEVETMHGMAPVQATKQKSQNVMNLMKFQCRV